MSLTELHARLRRLGFENSTDYLEAMRRAHDERVASRVVRVTYRPTLAPPYEMLWEESDGTLELRRMIRPCQN